MKTFRFAILFSATIIFGSCVAATPAHAQTAAEMEWCDSMYEVTGTIMEARQSGMPMQQQLDNATSAKATWLYRPIRAAYEVPVVKGRQNKAYEADQFALKEYLRCVKAMVTK